MKKLFLFLLISGSTQCYTTDTAIKNDPRNTLVTAIARSDVGTTLKALSEITDMTLEEKQNYLEMANQIIVTNMLHLNPARRFPEINKELLQSLAYYLGTLFAAAVTAIGIGVLIEKTEDDEPLVKNALFAVATTGVTSFLGYKTIRKFIDAWQRPQIRLENSMRIKDAISHHVNPIIQLPMNTRGSESIGCGVAVGALKYQESIDSSPYGTAVGCSHLGYDHSLNGDCGCNCSWCLSVKYNIVGGYSYSTAVGGTRALGYTDFANECICDCLTETKLECHCVCHDSCEN